MPLLWPAETCSARMRQLFATPGLLVQFPVCRYRFRKSRIYRKNGVIQVWADPGERQVGVISPAHGTGTFAEGETAVIEELPGFELNFFPLDRSKRES